MSTNAIAGVELGDPELAAATAAGLDRVEELLHREVHSEYRFVTETSLHLIDAGGKRFRPAVHAARRADRAPARPPTR